MSTIGSAKAAINAEVRKLLVYRKELLDKLSFLDCETSDILHMLENGGINAVEISKITKKLSNIRRERRKIKNQIAQIDSISNAVKRAGNPSSVTAETYELRTDVISKTIPKYSDCKKGTKFNFRG